MRDNIQNKEWSACLGFCRDARALILRNAEAFQEAATVLETIGQIITGTIGRGLASYQKSLMKLAEANDHADPVATIRLFNKVRNERNMATHDGAWARHANSRLIDLFLILEQAMMTKITTAEEVMVRNPIIAETWHMVSHARRTMLENSFSFLPICLNGKWHLISEVALIKYLHLSEGLYNDLLSTRLEKAIQSEALVPTNPRCVAKMTEITELRRTMNHEPLLVTQMDDSNAESEKWLLGIITPFDLL